MSHHIPDPTQPDRLAITSNGDLAGGVYIGPARADNTPPTAAELNATTHIGWATTASFGGRDYDGPSPSTYCNQCGCIVPIVDETDEQIGYEEKARDVHIRHLDCGHDEVRPA